MSKSVRSKRKPIGQKLRFEVFKRDSFTCQYCGRAAPDVTLHVDHIAPVANGGENDVLNLITSCSECNGGKGARELSDDSAVQVQRNQLVELNERREQLEMMLKWRDGLRDLERSAVEMACERMNAIMRTRTLNEHGIDRIRKLIKKASFQVVISAIDAAAHKVVTGSDGAETVESCSAFVEQVHKIASVEAATGGDKSIARLYYARGILNRTCGYLPKPYAVLNELKSMLRSGADPEFIVASAKAATSWSRFKDSVWSSIGGA